MNKTKDSDNEDDISDTLNKEINKLKAEYSKPINARRFQVNFSDIFLSSENFKYLLLFYW